MHHAIRVVLHLSTESSLQFLSIFGLLIGGGAALTYISRLTTNTFRQFIYPNLGIYLFGWIGVPVHEFCHAFFCALFLHEVNHVKWFDPKAQGGTHGSVTHEYDPWNPYHRLGHFFIGVGPVLLGPLILAALFYVLVPMGRGIFHPGAFTFATATTVGVQFAMAIVCKATLKSPAFYLFVYLAVCISSQMELSMADIKQAASGIVPLLLLLFIINALARWMGLGWQSQAYSLSLWTMAIGSVLFSFAALVATVNLLLCLLIMTLINRCLGREGINPFRM